MTLALAQACLLATCVSYSLFNENRTPEQVAQAYFQGLQAGDWQRVAAEFSPEAQQRFRAMMTDVLEAVPVADQSSVHTSLFGGPHTPEQVAKLSDAEFLAKVLGTTMGAALGAVQFHRMEVVGSVIERAGVAHVVCRAYMGSPTAGDVAVERMLVVTVEKGSSGWGVGLSGEIKGLGAMLKRQLANKAPARSR